MPFAPIFAVKNMKTRSRLILKGISKDTGLPFIKEIHTLNEVKTTGDYVVIGRNISISNGLPPINGKQEDCFCCECVLIVTCCYSDDESQSSTTYGQKLIISDRETGTTNTFTRTITPHKNDGEWSEWQMSATGDIELISQNNDIIERISNLVNQISAECNRATAKEQEIDDKLNNKVANLEVNLVRVSNEIATIDKESINFCSNNILNTYIRELYISGADAISKGFYIARIIKNKDNTCAIYVHSADESITLSYQTNAKIPYGYIVTNNNGYTLEAIINFENVAEAWGELELNKETGKLLQSAFDITLSPYIANLHFNIDIKDTAANINAGLDVLQAEQTKTNVSPIYGSYIQQANGTVSAPYENSFYSEFYLIPRKGQILYSGTIQYQAAAWSFYDENKNFISAYPETSTTTVLKLEKAVVGNIPPKAVYIRFGSLYGKFSANIAGYIPLIEELSYDNKEYIDSLKNLYKVQATNMQGAYLQQIGTISGAYDVGRYSDYYSVNKELVFSYSGTVQYQAAAWAFYDENKNFISAYPETTIKNEINVIDEVVPDNAKFIRFGSLYSDFNANIYPKSFALRDEWRDDLCVSKNTLFGKSVHWIGDSITEGSVRMTPSFGGWAKIISERNKMEYKNYGVGGTCITQFPDAKNSIVERIQEYSKDVDFLILQGGLNDSSKAESLGAFGEITETYDGVLDCETYCGACEWLCKYVMQNYSGKKYGFIITFNIASNTWNKKYADALVDVCKKWGMPYFDLRTEAGFNLYSPELRKLYGTYIGDVASYDATKGYSLDEQIKYEGALYKANVEMPAPAGNFDISKWTLQQSDGVSDYDNWHCNVLAYNVLADKIESWMELL